MDFMERLTDKVNEMQGLPVPLRIGYLGKDESFVVYPLPGSRVVQEYMDGTKDWQLNYEFAMKSKSQSKIHATLWLVQNQLEALKDLTSKDGSFAFEELVVTNKPFINQLDDQGWFVFLLNIQANITVFKEEK
ncbi:minor capsid protein [Sutcliffiella cohnii]